MLAEQEDDQIRFTALFGRSVEDSQQGLGGKGAYDIDELLFRYTLGIVDPEGHDLMAAEGDGFGAALVLLFDGNPPVLRASG